MIRSLFCIIISSIILYSCSPDQSNITEQGVSKDLAGLREKQISEINYFIFFDIPDSLNAEIKGKVTIEFNFTGSGKEPLVIDFQNSTDKLLQVKFNQGNVNYNYINQHIVLPNRKVNKGKNRIEIDFIATDRALNRNSEYLYTLFVPDRASTAFPCFDQPSLKARFTLSLKIPEKWIAIANSGILEKESTKSYSVYTFKETEPISTYLFAFTAGKFKSITKTKKDRAITMYHRESDSLKVIQNTDKIFELQFTSLEWLEKYTNISYPFQKFDFIVIPSFQYSGMEHPGAILYRDSKLFLDPSASVRDELTRANLIAHETAHMWFGDLVTMQWFGQVWLKEVFANFIADKIVNPQFPEINHQLNFIINHFPESYSVDRTSGANPIDQELENMKDAGTLYGSIIYHKAPIVMQHLETITGDSILQAGLQEYLLKNMYGNANWNDLISILKTKTDFELENWSKQWVNTPGMPKLRFYKAFNERNEFATFIIEQTDLYDNYKLWPQNIDVGFFKNKIFQKYPIQVSDTFSVIPITDKLSNSELILPNLNGNAYGYFELDNDTKNYLVKNLSLIQNPVYRSSIYIMLWENMLNRNMLPNELISFYTNAVTYESDQQNISLLQNYITSLYWRFLTRLTRERIANQIEEIYWDKIKNSKPAALKLMFLKSYISISTSNQSFGNLYRIWNGEIKTGELELSENDFTDLSFELALRSKEKGDSILAVQLSKIQDNERKKRMKFIIPSLSHDSYVRDSFFESLKDERNREKEPWVISALTYLHHPLRSNESVRYITPSLKLLQEIQQTGDIFFPKQWLDATLSGHSGIDAVTEVQIFLNENPGLPENLKNKIVQSSDLLYRACQIKNE
ncbi:MAG: hypothetical protein A2X13_01505 [Bacteroidetes bacterium GWC2_33_15]|nr:MAG: hypothetical protein A2X10_08120 [Bacteroidetes bacterium GWA2_33_15]OFX52158.1 MAG: hypothetical protein A2X13_01505 [Bacteroidetes bacterium GWC2_33_15]OFX64312.1 MAG: hypothetical protein A2X15_12325 [Bacteroidetes bacterium GWB2_32_14]OFX67717.1 MAG: hypothetical protein A2X14_06150 [Bacteroidetes bacterium GWD2_33_33]HAN19327.1 hypothetical protein [Bacteroidales bacterium]